MGPTDGVTEADASDGRFLTAKHMVSILETPASTATELLDRIATSVQAHINGAHQFDDITLLAVRRICCVMNNWIPFTEGEYLVEQAFLVADQDRAVSVEGVVVEVYSGRQGQRFLRGRGRVRNILMIELLEDSDDLDLLLDFGDEFKYLLKVPNIQIGKVFSPDVKSALQFTPKIPWRQIQQKEFRERLSRLQILPE